MKLEDLREQFRTQVRNEKLQQMEIVPRVARPEDAELRAYYEKNKAKMLTPEKRRVSHILFLQDEAIPLADQVKFKKTIEKVYQEAMAGGDFAKLAAQYSQDEASRENGGDIGWVEPGSLSPEFEAVVFQLKKGRVSEVFPSRAGLHIVKVTDIRPAAPLSFEDAKNQIRDVILQEAFEKEFERWVEEKKTSYGIRIHLRNGDTFTFERGLWHGVDGKTVTSADLNGLLKRELDASENAGGAAVR
jgi:parvulin-like peptidyl-prolyl isomerase